MTKILFLITVLIMSCKGTDRKVNSAVNPTIQLPEAEALKEAKTKEKLDCFEMSLKWNVKDSSYIDTIVSVRNAPLNDSSKKVICNSDFTDLEVEALIWNCKYIAVYMKYLERLKKFALLGYTKLPNSTIVVHFYLVGQSDLKAIEAKTFLIAQNKIIGLKMFPFLTEFTPIEEFEKNEFVGPDPDEMDVDNYH